MSHARNPVEATATYARFVKFEHTVFSLPLIVAGALIGDHVLRDARMPGALTLGRLLLIFVAAAGARTFALAMNRIIDHRLDALNPRTAVRELPSGRMRLREGWVVAAVGAGAYWTAAAFLPPICLLLSPIPIVVFVGYPYLKRFTPLCHLGVGLGLALSPLGGFLGVAGSLRGLGQVLPLFAFALCWVSGFDIIYATLDEAHDRAHGVRALPATLGRAAALRVSAALHVLAFASLAIWAMMQGVGPWAWACLAAVGALLWWEQRAAQHVELAFFRINSGLGFVVLALVWVGLAR
jgi:4-hydroxybenzoate polyprenyltransferase